MLTVSQLINDQTRDSRSDLILNIGNAASAVTANFAMVKGGLFISATCSSV